MAQLVGNSGNTSKVSTTVLVLVFCNLILLFSKLDAPPPPASHKAMPLDPLSFVGSRLSVMAMAYLSTSAYAGKHHRCPQKLLSRMLWTWRRPAITLAYIELFATASASLVMMLRAFAGATRGLALEVFVICCSLALLSRLGPVLLAHSEIACRLSLVVSVVEEDCEGMGALRRAQELVEERKLQGLALTVALGLVEQAVSMVLGFRNDGVWDLRTLVFAGPVLLTIKFVAYLAYTVFYFECKKGHAKEKRLKLIK